MTDPEIRQALRAVLGRWAAELAGVRVVLFGSRARGKARPRSDYDIGLLGPGPVPAVLLSSLRDELESLPTLAKFDVVDLARAGEKLRRAALAEGEVLFE